MLRALRLVAILLIALATVAPAAAQSIITVAGNPARSGVNSLDLALNGGTAVAFDGSGAIYVSNGTSVYRIVGSTATLVAGTGVQGPTVAGALAVATRFVQIGGIAVDAAGDLYVADESQGRVYRVRASDRRVESVAGGGFEQGTSAPGEDIAFSFPSHLAFDASGRLLVGDSLRLYRIDTSSRFVTHVAGNGMSGPSGDGGPATAAGVFCGQFGIDAAQNIYCAAGTLIRRITPGGIISTFAGTGVSGSTGNGGPALSAQISANHISVFGNQLVFAGSSRIRAIDLTTTIVSAVAGTGVDGSTGDGGSATAAQTSAQRLGHFPGGSLVIVEVRRVRTIVGATINGLAFNGVTTSGLSGPGINAQIGRPEHLVADTLGNVYFSASTQVFRRNVDGTVTLIAGLPNNNANSGDGGQATSAGLVSVGGLALDGAGNLYISQSFSNHRIRRVNLGSGIITTFAGTGIGGFLGDGGLATAARLDGPTGMVVVGGVLYVADRSNHRIRAINLSTNIISPFAGNGTSTFSGDGGAPLSAGLPLPEFMAVDGTGRIYVTSSRRVRRIALGVITTRAGNGSAGVPAEGGLATLQPMGAATPIAANADGDLYISDGQSHRVWVVPALAGTIQTQAGNGLVESSDFSDFGTFSGDGGRAALAGLNNPFGVALDSGGRLVIADRSNGRLRRVDGLNNAPPTISGPGAATVLEDGSTVLNFTVGDATTEASALVFTAVSSDDTLVNAAGLVVSGTGTARALTITPRPDANGAATLTITLLDANGGVTRRAIALTVTAVNDLPTLGPIADVSGQDNAPLIALVVADDIDGPDFDLTATSSNPAVLPNGNLDFDSDSGTLQLVMVPVAGASGSSIITVTFSDGLVTLTRSFTATVFLTPQAPVLTRADVDGAVAEVRWNAPAAGVTPTGYLVEAGPTGQPPTVTASVGPTARRAELLLPSSGDWVVRVRTRNNAALSDPSSASTLAVTGVSGRPRDLVATVSGSLVTFRWTLPTNGTRTGYRLEAGSAATLSDLANLALPPTATAFSVVAPNGTFFVRMRTLNGAGDSRASNEIRLVVGGPPALPAPPDDVQVEAQDGAAVFRWAAPVDGGVPAQFVLDAGSAPGLSNLATGLPVGAGFAFAAGAPNGTYFVRLRSVNGGGSSAASNEVVLGLPAAGAPLAAPGLMRVNVDASRLVTLAWQAPVEGAATGFVVEAGSASGLANLAVLATGPGTTLQVSAPPGTYFVRVRAQNALGVSAVSNEVVVVVP